MEKKKIDALRQIANQKIQKIVEALGIEVTERYQYIHAACPVHKGDRNDAWSFHLDLGIWQCFSRGCHMEYGKDVFGLVRGTLDIRFPDAIAFVKKICELDGPIDLDAVVAEQANQEYVKRVKKREEVVYPEEALTRLSYHSYLEGRGYPVELINSYHIGVTSSQFKEMSNRVIVPIRNVDGAIIGFTGRTLDPNWKENGISKWRHSRGFQAESHLFNIDRAAKVVRETGTAIICEGPFDVLRFEQAGIHNSMAIFGRKLHNGQIGLLLKIGTQKLIIALDSDVAGSTGAESAMQTAKAFFDVEIIKPEGAKDVGDMPVERVREVFGDAKIRN
jgi:DNA primase